MVLLSLSMAASLSSRVLEALLVEVPSPTTQEAPSIVAHTLVVTLGDLPVVAELASEAAGELWVDCTSLHFALPLA